MISKCIHGKFNCDECKHINGYNINHKFPEFNPPPTTGPTKTKVLKPITNFTKGRNSNNK